MKLKLQNLLFLFLLGAIGTKAQGPVITAEGYNPRVGDSYKFQPTYYYTFTPPNIDTGANRVWDYSNLQDSGSATVFSFISPNGLANSDSFPSATLASVRSIPATYTIIYFYKTSDTSFGQLGGFNIISGKQSKVGYLSPATTLMKYPMSYGVSYIDSVNIYNTGSSTSSLFTPGISHDTLRGIGYGTLKLPNATYDSVVCMFSSRNGRNSYLFLRNGIKSSLMTISYNSFRQGDTIRFLQWWTISYYKGTALPLQITSFTADWQNKTPFLQWSATNTENTKQFNIQRSTDSKNFVTVGQVGINGGSAYHFQDNTAPNTTVYYRLQQVDKNGAAFYSSTARLTVNSLPLTVFPNPAKGAIHLTIPATSQAQVFIYDIAGKLVYQNKNYNSTNTIATDTWSKGTYTIRLKDNDGWKVSSFEKE